MSSTDTDTDTGTLENTKRMNSIVLLTYEFKGDALMQLKNYTGAIECFNEALKIGTNDSVQNVNKLKGDANYQLKNYDEAIKAYKKVIDNTPEDTLIYKSIYELICKILRIEKYLTEIIDCTISNEIYQKNQNQKN